MSIGTSPKLVYMDQKFILAALLHLYNVIAKVDKVKTAMPVNTVGFVG